MLVGHRGLVGLFVMYKSHGAKGQRFETRLFLLFFVGHTRQLGDENVSAGR